MNGAFVSEDGRVVARIEAGKALLERGPTWIDSHVWPGTGRKPVDLALQPGGGYSDGRISLKPQGAGYVLDGAVWTNVPLAVQTTERMQLLDLQRRASAASLELRDAEEAVVAVKTRIAEAAEALDKLKETEYRIESLQREAELLAKGMGRLKEQGETLERVSRAANKLAAALEELPAKVAQAGTSASTRIAAIEKEARAVGEKHAQAAAEALREKADVMQREQAAAQRRDEPTRRASVEPSASAKQARLGWWIVSLTFAVVASLVWAGRTGGVGWALAVAWLGSTVLFVVAVAAVRRG